MFSAQVAYTESRCEYATGSMSREHRRCAAAVHLVNATGYGGGYCIPQTYPVSQEKFYLELSRLRDPTWHVYNPNSSRSSRRARINRLHGSFRVRFSRSHFLKERKERMQVSSLDGGYKGEKNWHQCRPRKRDETSVAGELLSDTLRRQVSEGDKNCCDLKSSDLSFLKFFRSANFPIREFQFSRFRFFPKVEINFRAIARYAHRMQ